MLTSEARLIANRANAAKSTGPKTPEGKAASRRNGLKHGLSGQGIVLDVEEADEVERRSSALLAELGPKSTLGVILVGQLATLSVKMERGAKQESAALASRVRHASDDFDDERDDVAEALFANLAEAPRQNLRKLRKSPEGVERLIEAWGDLRSSMIREPQPLWTPGHFEKLAHLLGLRPEGLNGSRLDALSKMTWGDFAELSQADREGLEVEPLKAWARAQLLERIDEEMAGLEAHYETLDFDLIEKDRAEAGDRALFDPSREANLARRYESEARRGFFKALDQFRRAEAEFAELEASRPVEMTPEKTSPLGSSRESQGVTPREPEPGYGARPSAVNPAHRGAESVDNRGERRPVEAGKATSPVG